MSTRSVEQSRPTAKATLVISRVLGVLVVLFLLFDAVTKIWPTQLVIDAFARLGIPIRLAPVIGTILLINLVLYVVPRTRVFGAVLLTGYLGGAVAVNLLAGNPIFETLFPVIFGILVWAPLYLVDDRLRALIPLQQRRS